MMYDSPVPPLRSVEAIPFDREGEAFVILRDPHGFSDKMIAVAAAVLPVIGLFDGHRSLQDIASLIEHKTGEPLPPEQLAGLVDILDNALLLNSPDFLRRRLEVEADFHHQQVRDSILSGSGYPEDAGELAQKISQMLAAPPAEDFEPEAPLPGRLRGIMVPHIDYHRGGATYGRLYREVQPLLPGIEEGPLLVVVLGVAHAGAFEPLVAADKDFRTPFGLMTCDRDALGLLREKLGDSVLREEFVHKAEHSIEIQIPWLQYLLSDRPVTFLPLLAGILDPSGSTPSRSEKVRKALAALREIEKRHPGPVLWVSSVDFAHMGPSFGDKEPVADSLLASIERRDMKSLQAVRELDADGWWNDLMQDDNGRRICGLNANFLTLSLLKGCRGRIIDYQQALDEERNTLVSFAAALFHDSEGSRHRSSPPAPV